MTSSKVPIRKWVASDAHHKYFKKKEVALLEKAIISSETNIVDCVTSDFITTTVCNDSSDHSENTSWIIQDMTSSPLYIKSHHLSHGSLHPFGICKHCVLIYHIPEGQDEDSEFEYLMNDPNDAKLFLVDRGKGDLHLLCTWNVSLRGYHRRNGPKFAHLGCAISFDGKFAIVLGPSNAYRGPSDGCKLLDLHKRKFIQEIKIPGYMKVAMATFDPRPGRHDVVTLVCCRRHELCIDYARPNTCGEMLVYCLSTNQVVNTYSEMDISTEILRYSEDGELIITRSNREKSVLIFDSESLQILCRFPHDVSKFRPNHFSFTTLYKFFPLVSACSSHIAVMNYDNVLPQWTSTQDFTHGRYFQSVYIQVYKLPVSHVLTLKAWCRRIIRAHVTEGDSVSLLPLPQAMLDYLVLKTGTM